jgi:zinc protease
MIRWANGVRLNLKSTDYTDNEVRFALSFGRGRSAVSPEMPALAALAEDVVNESGLGGMDQETLRQALAGKNTHVQFTLKDDRFAFEGRSTPEEMELVFQLLYAYLVDPAFREDAWHLSLNRYRQSYRSMRRSVDGVMDLYGWRFFSGGDPRFGLPSPEALETLSATHVENWIAPALRRGHLELAVVGDVDPEALLRLADRYLGTLPDRGQALPLSAGRPGPDFPEARQMAVPVRTQIDKRLLVMALPTDDIWDIQRTRRLNVLAEIVSERLRVGIREKLGVAYSTAAFNWPSRAYPGYGILVIHIPLAGDTLDMVQAEVRRILLDIRDRGVSRDELQRALEPILTGIKDRYRDNGYWLNTVLADASRHPVQLEWSRSIMEDYAGIDKEAIDAVARRYIDPAKLGIVRAYPILPGTT